MDLFIDAVAEIRYGWAFLAVALAVIALQIVAFFVARKRPTRLVEIAGFSLLALPIFAGISVHAARTMMLGAAAATDPSEKARALSAGMSGQLNAIPFSVIACDLAVLLWLLAFQAARRARDPSGDAPSFAPVALIGLGLVAVSVGALQWSIVLIKGLAALAGVEPEKKTAFLLADLDFARAHLELFARISRFTIAGMAVLAVVLTVFGRRTAGRDPSSGRRSLLLSAAAIALAGILVVAARPMSAENRQPWPPALLDGDRLPIAEPRTPDLVGPDTLERAPVVQLFLDHVALDGRPIEMESLESMLWTLHQNYNLLQPGQPWSGIVLVVADAKVSIARLLPALRAAHDALYENPTFAFTRRETTVRPILGTLERVRATAVRVALVGPEDVEARGDERGGADGVLVRTQDLPSFDALARRVLAVRASGKAAILNVGK